MSVTREFSSGGVSLAHPTKVIKTTASDLCHVEGYTMTRKKCVVHQLNIYFLHTWTFTQQKGHCNQLILGQYIIIGQRIRVHMRTRNTYH